MAGSVLFEEFGARPTRRSFLRTALVLPLAISAAGAFGGASPAEAVVPVAAVLAAIQAAVSVAKLFSSGPSVSAVLAQEGAMLAAISQQLEVIHQDLLLVLERLDDIQKALGELPAEIVAEFHRETIKALPIQYTERRQAYDQDVRTLGLVAAREHHRPRLESDLLHPLVESRTVLLGSPSKVNVPILALALHIEIATRILLDDTDGDIDSALKRYREWFHARVNELPQDIADLRKRRQDARTKVVAMRRDLNCLYDYADIAPGVSRYRVRVGPIAYTTALLQDAPAEFRQLVLAGLLSDEDLPCLVQIDGAEPPVGGFLVTPTTQRPQPCDNYEAPLRTEAAQLSSTFTDTAYLIAADVALLDCAHHALAAIDRWGKPS